MWQRFNSWMRRAGRRHRRGPCGRYRRVRQRLNDWYSQGLGAAVGREEQRELREALATLFGYHLVQVGHLSSNEHLESSYIRHQVVLDLSRSSRNVQCFAEPGDLPIASGSVDLVILPHVLETHADPHRVLREVDRILVPEGHVVIIGFNPWSLWGVTRLPMRYFQRGIPWCCATISPFRMKDWLSLLGFDMEQVKTFFFKPPISNTNLLDKMDFLNKAGDKLWPAFGGIYLYVAKKRVSTVTPIKPRWTQRRRVLQPEFVETRNRDD